MNIDQSQIDTFVDEVINNNQNGDENDPNRDITVALIELVRVQAEDLNRKYRQLSRLSNEMEAIGNTLRASIRRAQSLPVTDSTLSEQEVNEATQALNDATRRARDGETIAEYAGAVLKFVARVLV